MDRVHYVQHALKGSFNCHIFANVFIQLPIIGYLYIIMSEGPRTGIVK